MIDIGVASPRAQGQGNDQHRDCADETKDPNPDCLQTAPQAKKLARATVTTAATKYPATTSARRCMGATWNAGPGDHLHDLRKHGLRTHLLRTDDEAARGVHRCADHLVRCPLADRQRLTGQHRLIDRTTSFDHHAVHRHFLARPDPQEITDVDAD
jgi:hypothetical protein